MRYPSLRQGLELAICPSINGGGPIVPDLSGRNGNARLQNMDASDYPASRSRRVLDFDGSNDYLEIPVISPALGFCFSCWMLSGNSSRTRQSIFANSTDASPDIYVHVESIGGGTTQAMNFYNGGGYLGASSTFTMDTEWHHYAWVTNAAGRVTYYRDGVSLGLAALTWSPMNDNSNIATIGGIVSLLGSGFTMLGQLDDCRRYSRTLTEHEIRLLASEPGIGLKPERTSVFFGAQLFQAAWLAQSRNIIGGGVC